MYRTESPPDRESWHGLPRDYYRADDIFATELDRIWQSCWLFAGPTCEIPEPGDFFTIAIGDTPVLVIRGDDGAVRAFHNLCSHRGSVLCEDAAGRVGKSIVCPYHQWTYARDGTLLSCRDMGPVDRSRLALQPIATAIVAGMAFICLSANPPDRRTLDSHFAAAAPHGFDCSRVAHAIEYRVRANWKIVWENNRECYHCDSGHPQYVRSNFDSSEGERDSASAQSEREKICARAEEYWSTEGLSVKHTDGGLASYPDPLDPQPFPVSATRTILAEGYESESMDGRRLGPLMGTLRSPEVGVLRLRGVPSFWCHASCDHAVLTRVLPLDRETTSIRVTWLVAARAREGVDYFLEHLLPFWQLTSEQDWQLCERVARGVESPAFRPGPLSKTREYNLEAFFQWYLKRIS